MTQNFTLAGFTRPAPADHATSLRDVVGLLRRRCRLILLVAIATIAAATLALFAIKPVYTATALVLIDPSHKNLLDPQAQFSGSTSDSLRVDSEVELVKADTTLLAVAGQLQLAADPEFGLRLGLGDKLAAFLRLAEPALPTGDEALRTVMDNLRNGISVQRRGLTFLVAVSAHSTRPDFAATLANAVAKTYIAQQLQAKIAAATASRDIIAARLADAAGGVAQSEQSFDGFITGNLDRLSDITGRTDLVTLRDRLATLTRTETELQQSLASRDWPALADSVKDEALASLQRQHRDLANQLADMRSQASGLRNQLREAVLAGDLPSDMLTGLYELQQNAEIARNQYQTLLTRQHDLDTEAFLQVADSRIASEALPPTSASFPNARLLLPAAALAGLALGIGLAVLRENFVGGFTSTAQLTGVLHIPVAAAIPRRKAGKHLALADLLATAPLSPYAEAIRRLRICIDQALRRSPSPDKAGAVIMVSSSAPGEGKTTIALALARAYALSGLSTLLIDCDLRKPDLHYQLDAEASEGLLGYLAGKSEPVDLKSIIATDTLSGAQIILGARRGDIATDQLLAGKTFLRLLDTARRNFDIILLDTPPIGPVVDGMQLAALADAVVFAIKWSATPQREVRAALDSLALPETTPLLVALNQEDRGRGRYYGGYYAKGAVKQ